MDTNGGNIVIFRKHSRFLTNLRQDPVVNQDLDARHYYDDTLSILMTKRHARRLIVGMTCASVIRSATSTDLLPM